jgi:LuxR family transcriptional regulator, maltose regulon positive regulatory protein
VALVDVPVPREVDAADHSLLVRLAASLSDAPAPVVLVLDRAEHLTSARIMDDLDSLLAHAGRRLRLVVCARRDPDLSLPRRRVDGTITEIRFFDLAFDPQEAAAVLAKAVPDLTEGHVIGLRAPRGRLGGGLQASRLVGGREKDRPW